MATTCTGVLTDDGGKPLVGVNVYIVNSVTGAVATTVTTNGYGVYSATGLAEGSYYGRAKYSAEGMVNYPNPAGTDAPGGDTGAATNLAFVSTDYNTVSWGVASIIVGGTTYSIAAGNTGNMTALTYIYLDTAVSTTVLQTTTTLATAVGATKTLFAVAQPDADTSGNASIIPYNGASGMMIDGALSIAALSIVAGQVAANTITGANILTMDLTAKTLTATQGTVGGWTLAATTLTGGNLVLDSTGIARAGATAILTGDGWYLNAVTTPTFRVGTVSGGALVKGLYWSGTTFEWAGVNTSLTAAGAFTATSATITGTITTSNITATGGTVGGWTIGATTLVGGYVTLDSAGKITIGVGGGLAFGPISTAESNAIYWLDGASAEYAWIYSYVDATGNSYLYQVNQAASGKIVWNFVKPKIGTAYTQSETLYDDAATKRFQFNIWGYDDTTLRQMGRFHWAGGASVAARLEVGGGVYPGTTAGATQSTRYLYDAGATSGLAFSHAMSTTGYFYPGTGAALQTTGYLTAEADGDFVITGGRLGVGGVTPTYTGHFDSSSVAAALAADSDSGVDTVFAFLQDATVKWTIFTEGTSNTRELVFHNQTQAILTLPISGTYSAYFSSPQANTGAGWEAGIIVANTNATASNRAGILFADTSGGAATAAISCQLTDRTNHYGALCFSIRSAGGFADRMYLSSAGVLSVDGTGSSGSYANVDLFDEHDDAMVLYRGVSLRQAKVLESMGVMQRKEDGRGWWLNVQPMLYLLAGGVYQNRQRMDKLLAAQAERIAQLERRLLA